MDAKGKRRPPSQPGRPGLEDLWAQLTLAARPGPAAAAASRRQPGKRQESQAGASRNTASDNRQPQPQPYTRLQKARLPFPRLRWHRKHFLGLSDSTPHQSWNRTGFLLRKVSLFLEEEELGAEREGANRRRYREKGRGFLVTAHQWLVRGLGVP